MQENNPLGFSELATALAKAQSEFTTLKKSKTAKIKMKSGGEYSYKYADLSDLIDATRPACGKNGLAYTQPIIGDELVTWLIHTSGQKIESKVRLQMNLSPQEFGSYLTYFRRYALGAILGIAGEEDDDGAAGNAGAKDTPRAKVEPPKPKAQETKQDPNKITEAQVKRLYTIARKTWTDAEIKEVLQTELEINSSRDILKKDYEQLCEYFAANKGPTAMGTT